jgi:neuroligin
VNRKYDVSLSGATGFLRTHPGPDREGAVGGNLGLRDILAALQWVRSNIAAFGGDPNRVTVLGHDTGAALVNLLLISSAAKGKVGRLCSPSTTCKSA